MDMYVYMCRCICIYIYIYIIQYVYQFLSSGHHKIMLQPQPQPPKSRDFRRPDLFHRVPARCDHSRVLLVMFTDGFGDPAPKKGDGSIDGFPRADPWIVPAVGDLKIRVFGWNSGIPMSLKWLENGAPIDQQESSCLDMIGDIWLHHPKMRYIISDHLKPPKARHLLKVEEPIPRRLVRSLVDKCPSASAFTANLHNLSALKPNATRQLRKLTV